MKRLLPIVAVVLLALAVAAPSAGHHRPWHPKTPLPTLSLPPLTPTPVATPTAAPTPTPTATPTPPSSGTCSAAVHDSYTAVAPDGNTYPTWHPQRDPSGCYFRHDHGSDPRPFPGAYMPAFGYVNAVAGHPEPHNGFKVFRIREGDGQEWLWTVHMGTWGHNRVCEPMHSMELVIADSDGTLLAHLRFIADFGKSEANQTGGGGSFQPSACPTQAQDAANRGSVGVRQLSVNQVGENSQQYEPWKPDLRNLGLGFPPPGVDSGHIQFNNKTSVTTCADIECNSVILSNHRGMGALTVIQSTRFSVVPPRTGNFTVNGLPQYLQGKTVNLTHTCSPSPCNWFSGVDPNLALFTSMPNTGGTGKGDMATYNIDGQLAPPN